MRYLKNVTTLAYNPEQCTGCKRCIEVCPHAVFEMSGGKARITDRNRCMECGACALNCVFGALAVRSGVGCAAAIINSMIFGGEPSCDCGVTAAGQSKSCC